MRSALLLLTACALLPAACGEPAPMEKRVVVFGIDGLDPDFIREGIAEGRLPNFAKLVESGTLADLQTSWPPQSPVAWTNFITGSNPGKHGLYDFIHVDRSHYGVANSMAVSEPEGMVLSMFGYKLPLSGGETTLNRSMRSFWEVLDEAGVPVMVYRMPANFPVEPSEAVTFPDMGTPDLVFSASGHAYLWSADPARAEKESEWYTIQRAELIERPGLLSLSTTVEGPPSLKNPDPLLAEAEAAREADDIGRAARLEAEAKQLTRTVEAVKLFVDTSGDAPRLAVHAGRESTQDDYDLARTRWGIAELGGWTDWVQVDFEVAPMVPVSGWQRFYFKSAEPFEVYATPVQIDPFNPATPISTPDEAAAELAAAIGPYYSQGFPDAYISYKSDLLGTKDFISQSDTVFEERQRMMHFALDQFDGTGGLLFFYVGSLDLRCHMLWHAQDEEHPHQEPDAAEYAGQIRRVYDQVDALLGEAMERLAAYPELELMVMSDHGFAPFRRKLHVNDWLVQEGYLVLKDGESTGSLLGTGDETIVDWSRSKAYCIGFNGVILNRVGREPEGIVTDAEAPALLAEIAAKLGALEDGGEKVFRRVLPATEVFTGDRLSEAPDLQLGFAVGFGASDECATGQITGEGIVVDNDSRWSGSHLMDPEVVRGTLLFNKKHELAKDPALEDVTATLFHLFGVAAPADIDGQPLIR
jgi:predicted AlkP superfamily phosphohydrolase/phosphomutase